MVACYLAADESRCVLVNHLQLRGGYEEAEAQQETNTWHSAARKSHFLESAWHGESVSGARLLVAPRLHSPHPRHAAEWSPLPSHPPHDTAWQWCLFPPEKPVATTCCPTWLTVLCHAPALFVPALPSRWLTAGVGAWSSSSSWITQTQQKSDHKIKKRKIQFIAAVFNDKPIR